MIVDHTNSIIVLIFYIKASEIIKDLIKVSAYGIMVY